MTTPYQITMRVAQSLDRSVRGHLVDLDKHYNYITYRGERVVKVDKETGQVTYLDGRITVDQLLNEVEGEVAFSVESKVLANGYEYLLNEVNEQFGYPTHLVIHLNGVVPRLGVSIQLPLQIGRKRKIHTDLSLSLDRDTMEKFVKTLLSDIGTIVTLDEVVVNVALPW